MTLSLEDAAKDEQAVDQCAGCGTWHYCANLKQADGKTWCVLCFPAIGARDVE
jgi:hypothetical protein